jgi:cell division protein FtsB
VFDTSNALLVGLLSGSGGGFIGFLISLPLRRRQSLSAALSKSTTIIGQYAEFYDKIVTANEELRVQNISLQKQMTEMDKQIMELKKQIKTLEKKISNYEKK